MPGADARKPLTLLPLRVAVSVSFLNPLLGAAVLILREGCSLQ